MSVKTYEISKDRVWEAWLRVRAGQGAGGVDEVSIGSFEENIKDHLYRIWNRMSSGSYMPPAVRGVEIPKATGGVRLLGIPTIGDRVAQMVVKLQIEDDLEAIFLPDSYGYRPHRGALDAIGITKQRCWAKKWVLEFDIQGMFDNISHELLMRALKKHTQCKWALLYINRWLTAPLKTKGGAFVPRNKGTPQGGVVSPILSNLFLHYVFDVWVKTYYPQIPFARYADDGVLHCGSYQEAEKLRKALEQRFTACQLKLHEEKTRVVYTGCNPNLMTQFHSAFTFLGFTFRNRSAQRKNGRIITSFQPAVSVKALERMRSTVSRIWKIRYRTDLNLVQIAEMMNPVVRGWFAYYGRFYRTQLPSIARYMDLHLVLWAKRKYRLPNRSREALFHWLREEFQKEPTLMEHWKTFAVY